MAVTQSTPESLEIDVVPPALEDADGVLPAARVVVFRASEKVEELVALGCQRTGRSDMLAVAVGSDAAERPEIREAIAGSTFASHAFMDRAGGLAWPTPALLVRFEADADASARQQAIQLLGSAHLETSCYTHAPNLARVKLDVRTGSRVIDAALLLASHPAVAFAETDLNFTGSGGFVPNDPGFSLCWGHRNSSGFDMRSTFAWDSTLGSPSVRVLVIDVGVDESHPDLNLSPGRDFTDGSIDGSEGGQPRVTCDRHGTPVAGCISAIADNSLGTVGIAPGCRSVSARCFVSTSNCSGSWSANYSWTANALDWAAGQGIQVSNNSNIYGSSSSAVADAYASTRLGGMIHFACAGNNGNAVITYPATLPTVLAIGAAASNGVRASFSCYGSKLFALAPGSGIYSADNSGSEGYSDGDYSSVSGTSFASPYAAGIAALTLSANPALTPDDITTILSSTARDMGTAGFDTTHGWGLLDAGSAVERAACESDLDRSGWVDFGDISVTLLDFGTAGGSSDIDDNGLVDFGDIALISLNFGPCAG